jgi:hypothetical protein
VAASDDSEKAYLEAYAAARQAADAVDSLVGKLNSAASNFDRARWKRFDLFKAALDILKERGLEASDVLLAHAAADFSDWPTADEFWKAVAVWRAKYDDAISAWTLVPDAAKVRLPAPQTLNLIAGARGAGAHSSSTDAARRSGHSGCPFVGPSFEEPQ